MQFTHLETFGINEDFLSQIEVDTFGSDEGDLFGLLIIQEPRGHGAYDTEMYALNEEEFAGFFQALGKGLGAVGKGVGKGVLAVGKGIGKGTVGAGKLVGKGVTGAAKGIGKVFKPGKGGGGGGGGGGLFKKKDSGGGGGLFKKKNSGDGSALFKKKDGGDGGFFKNLFKKKDDPRAAPHDRPAAGPRAYAEPSYVESQSQYQMAAPRMVVTAAPQVVAAPMLLATPALAPTQAFVPTAIPGLPMINKQLAKKALRKQQKAQRKALRKSFGSENSPSAVDAMIAHRYGYQRPSLAAAFAPRYGPTPPPQFGPHSATVHRTDPRTADQRAQPHSAQVHITKIEPPTVRVTKIAPPPDPPAPNAKTARRWQEAGRASDEFTQLLTQAGVPVDVRKHWSLKNVKRDAQRKILSATYINPAYAFAFPVPLEEALQQMGSQAMNIAARHGTSVTALTIYPERGGPPQAMIAFSDDPSIAHRKYKSPFYAT